MEHRSIYLGDPTLYEFLDVLEYLRHQLNCVTDPWTVTCCGSDVCINLDYQNRCIIIDSEELFSEEDDEDDE